MTLWDVKWKDENRCENDLEKNGGKNESKTSFIVFYRVVFLIAGFLGLRATQVEFIQTQSLAKAAGASTAPSRQGKPGKGETRETCAFFVYFEDCDLQFGLKIWLKGGILPKAKMRSSTA